MRVYLNEMLALYMINFHCVWAIKKSISQILSTSDEMSFPLNVSQYTHTFQYTYINRNIYIQAVWYSLERNTLIKTYVKITHVVLSYVCTYPVRLQTTPGHETTREEGGAKKIKGNNRAICFMFRQMEKRKSSHKFKLAKWNISIDSSARSKIF